jgi:hypothetical protein
MRLPCNVCNALPTCWNMLELVAMETCLDQPQYLPFAASSSQGTLRGSDLTTARICLATSLVGCCSTRVWGRSCTTIGGTLACGSTGPVRIATLSTSRRLATLFKRCINNSLITFSSSNRLFKRCINNSLITFSSSNRQHVIENTQLN